MATSFSSIFETYQTNPSLRDGLLNRLNDGSDHYQETAALAYELNPEATLRGFIRVATNDDK